MRKQPRFCSFMAIITMVMIFCSAVIAPCVLAGCASSAGGTATNSLNPAVVSQVTTLVLSVVSTVPANDRERDKMMLASASLIALADFNASKNLGLSQIARYQRAYTAADAFSKLHYPDVMVRGNLQSIIVEAFALQHTLSEIDIAAALIGVANKANVSPAAAAPS